MIINAEKVYLHIERDKESATDDKMIDVIKLSSQGRAKNLHLFSLNGIGLSKQDFSHWSLLGTGHSEMYLLQSHREWHRAQNEKTLAFFDPGVFNEWKFSLIWG